MTEFELISVALDYVRAYNQRTGEGSEIIALLEQERAKTTHKK